MLPFPGITSLFVVALAAHSLGQAAAWQGCVATYSSADCSGAADYSGCGPVNEGCDEDGDDNSWDKHVSSAACCVDGAVIYESLGNADEAACNAADATVESATIGECSVSSGGGSSRHTCPSLPSPCSAATTTASAVLVLLAAVASHMF